MTFPTQTAFYAGVLGILFVFLSLLVSMGRAQFKAHHGDAGQEQLRRRIRIQANFAEYIPFALILIGLNEAGGAEAWIIKTLLIALLVARLAHPFGMVATEGSVQQYVLRAPAMMITWAVILAASVMLLTR